MLIWVLFNLKPISITLKHPDGHQKLVWVLQVLLTLQPISFTLKYPGQV